MVAQRQQCRRAPSTARQHTANEHSSSLAQRERAITLKPSGWLLACPDSSMPASAGGMD